jgi:hypothetical protein
MKLAGWLSGFTAVWLAAGCMPFGGGHDTWRAEVDRQAAQLGYRNWIVVAEASFPLHNRPGLRSVNAPVEVPEAMDYVLQALERTENLRPQVYLTRELRSVENDYAPGIDQLRERLREAMHGHEFTELDQQALLTLIQDANRSFEVLVIRTQTALPYSSVFLEMRPGYWDADSEQRLRERIQRERMQKLVRPFP